ncbi:MAG TPA: hypothetical protein VF631_02725 [Allosphingosinicella sp.]|jgi:hypothetical protein|uniref:hypothetical protein n=1 Tax=Allosphingosinicella sp. TaxID=2823234 RepID=UPI002F2ACC4E
MKLQPQAGDPLVDDLMPVEGRKLQGRRASPIGYMLNSRRLPAEALGATLDDQAQLSYVYNTPTRSIEMDFIKAMQPKDWVIAAVAFFAGALIF